MYGPENSGDELPEELQRREQRLAKIKAAKQRLERRQEQEDRARGRQEEDHRKSPRGGPDFKREFGEVDKKKQDNFTDPESRIMKTSTEGFQQSCNTQIAVDEGLQLIVGTGVTSSAADNGQLIAMVQEVKSVTGAYPERVLADAGYRDEDGYWWIMSRTDDVINVAGHRLSTGGMEEVLASHPDVAECAVIGVTDELKGQLPLGFLCLNAGCNRDPKEVVAECVKLVRDKIGPVAAFKSAVVVDRLPKTRSGKILRATMVSIADNKEFKMPATIDDPAILDEIREALETLGYAKV